MTRTDLMIAIADSTGLDRATVGTVLDALDERLLHAATDAEEVRWPGLFTLDVVDRPARSGRNPQTGEPILIPAGRSVRLRPGSRLKSAATAG